MKIRKNDEVIMNNNARIAVLENTVLHINATLNRMDKKFDSIDNKIDILRNETHNSLNNFKDFKVETQNSFKDFKVETQNSFKDFKAEVNNNFRDCSSRIDKLSEKGDTNFKWLVGTMISLFLITVLSSFLHH